MIFTARKQRPPKLWQELILGPHPKSKPSGSVDVGTETHHDPRDTEHDLHDFMIDVCQFGCCLLMFLLVSRPKGTARPDEISVNIFIALMLLYGANHDGGDEEIYYEDGCL